MKQLVKYDFLVHTWGAILSVFILIPIGYAVNLPPISTYIIVLVTSIITLFYYDTRANANHFLVSLPISKSSIVKSRYQSVIIFALCILIYQWIIGHVLPPFFEASNYVYSWKEIMILASLSALIAAIVIPFFYLFRSFIIAAVCVLIIVFITTFYLLGALITVLSMEDQDMIIFNDLDPGFVLLVEKHIPVQPFLILPLVSIVILYVSIAVSTQLFSKKDI
ncbi:ABC-2 transporter permease [Virgibacillus sp. C22-A2]|uniref:ABC-2 transporter permease n=1 Tax=Virgibacillus tibetensis TaxID=3042313 RepID=A0ABU6KF06_9BACI|nr:ABC-2 transporter permease [Virgibacillus sp. C22-A2]